MGAAIAAQIANAGVDVLLLDILPSPDHAGLIGNRNAIADGAVERMLRAQPAPFMSRSAVQHVRTGNVEDDLGKLAAVDWIVEAVAERIDVKRELYRRIDQVRRSGTAISRTRRPFPYAR